MKKWKRLLLLSENTNKSTNTSLAHFKAFLRVRGLGEIEEIDDLDLPKVLGKFYTDVRTKKNGEQYKTSSFKVLRAGLNRYFKRTRNIDIVSDQRFVNANLLFDGVQVNAKKKGKGVTKSTQQISSEDMTRIGCYFDVDHMKQPQPKILRECIQFYIMYFFCRWGQENLYEMTVDHFKINIDSDGTRYVSQIKDEKDKNHGVNDTAIANQGKMYEDPGEKIKYSPV